jgi:RimJ/RimL family protein N-acetyltransferase
MAFELQPTNLKNELVQLVPLQHEDFEILYKVASDPLIWEQHPNKNRYKREVFKTYFEGAMESGGAFIFYDVRTGEPVGSSRFYEYDEEKNSVAIGYTFLARDHWGSTYNTAVKSLMLDHAFRFVENVIFHIGANNIRSQKAIERLGAKKISELQMNYYGEQQQLNFVYNIKKKDWEEIKTHGR